MKLTRTCFFTWFTFFLTRHVFCTNIETRGGDTHVFSEWTESPCCLLLEASSAIDPESRKGLYRRITNPTWVIGK